MDKKAKKKMIFEREDKSKKSKVGNINNLRQAFCGNKIDKKPLKTQENNHVGLLCTKQKHRNTEKPKKTKPPKPKKAPKKHLCPFWQTTPIFCFFFLLSLMSAKLCFAENTIKIVFSAEHSIRNHR